MKNGGTGDLPMPDSLDRPEMLVEFEPEKLKLKFSAPWWTTTADKAKRANIPRELTAMLSFDEVRFNLKLN